LEGDTVFKNLTTWLVLILGIAVGILLLAGIRFVAFSAPEKVHYHANFAVFINGQQQPFKDPGYYQETEMCTTAGAKTPTERVHMHDDVNNVVHVEDSTVTWGQFFENLGWSVGDSFIKTPDGLLVNGDQGKMSFLLNGEPTIGIARTVIKDNDRLLVSYGSDSNSDLMKQYASVPTTSHKYDVAKDPKSCSGHGERATMADRLKYAFQL
jgi:hypothetical protein